MPEFTKECGYRTCGANGDRECWFKDSGGGCVLGPYRDAGEFEGRGWVKVQHVGGRWGVIDWRGKTIVPMSYDRVSTEVGADGELFWVVATDDYSCEERKRTITESKYNSLGIRVFGPVSTTERTGGCIHLTTPAR
jgi:hypothetical protein